MAHPDDRACLAGRTLAEVILPDTQQGLSDRAELRRTTFKYPYLARWNPRPGDPGEEPYWAVATNLLVTLRAEVHPQEAEQILRELASSGEPAEALVRVKRLPLPQLYLVERLSPYDFGPETPQFLLARRRDFLDHGAVEAANPDFLYFTFPNPVFQQAAPAPPRWELDRIGVTEAHRRGFTGSRKVRVAILDTGVDTRHEDLEPNILYEQGQLVGHDIYRNLPSVSDGNGHGTYCAGLVGGAGYGVNREVSIIPVQWLNDSGCGDTVDAIDAIEFALRSACRVISNSWGGVADSPDLKKMIEKANQAGALFVAGAGNAPRDLDTVPYYPACYRSPNMLVVGGSLDSDDPADRWGFGKARVHLAAPGETVLSTHHDPRHGETWRSGTSVSTALVAGACALVMAEHPKWSHLEVRKRIIQSVQPMASGTSDPFHACCSGGRLNVLNAVTGDLLNSFTCPG